MASKRHRAAGFSLVEVLVSIVVLSVGLLGMIGMLLASVRTGNETATFTAALNLARELSEKARMNKGVAARNDAANAYLVEDWREGACTGCSLRRQCLRGVRRGLQHGRPCAMGHERVEAPHRQGPARCAPERVLRRSALECGGGRIHVGVQQDRATPWS
jgi:prepilin-type N-terminal cleavage/methylation domain-containing protein